MPMLFFSCCVEINESNSIYGQLVVFEINEDAVQLILFESGAIVM